MCRFLYSHEFLVTVNEQLILIVPIMTFCVSFYMVPGDESFAKKSKVIWILRSMIVHVSHLVVPGMAYLQHDFYVSP